MKNDIKKNGYDNQKLEVSTSPSITSNFGSVNFNDLDGVPEGIPEKQPEHQNANQPYMGNLTSHQIGMMAKYGELPSDNGQVDEYQ